MAEPLAGGSARRGRWLAKLVIGTPYTGRNIGVHHAGIIRPELPLRWLDLELAAAPVGMVAIPAFRPSLLPLVDHSPVNLFAPTPVGWGSGLAAGGICRFPLLRLGIGIP